MIAFARAAAGGILQNRHPDRRPGLIIDPEHFLQKSPRRRDDHPGRPDRRRRVCAALSDSNHLSADLGTRHRAGVGMSEASDAVVVIVSEETGTISVAWAECSSGILRPDAGQAAAQRAVSCRRRRREAGLGLRLKQKLYFRRKETDDNENKFGAILLSVAIAFGLWLYVTYVSPNSEET